MKILGESKDDYILRVSHSELAKILGYNSLYSDGFTQKIKEYRAYPDSVTFNVSRIYDQHEAIKNIKNYKNIVKVREELKSILKLLEPMQEIIEGIPTVVKE